MTVAPANTSMVGGTSTARSSFHCPGLSRLEGESPMGPREKKNKARGHLTRGAFGKHSSGLQEERDLALLSF